MTRWRMSMRSELLWVLVFCLLGLSAQPSEGGNELRPGEVIWECDDYAWRSLAVPIHDQPGEYHEEPIVIASDPEGCIWINADGCMSRFDGLGFEFDENMPGVYPSEQKLAMGRDRISGDDYAAWIRKVIHHPRYSESYVIRYQDGEYDWWFPHTPEYPEIQGAAADIGIDSSGLVWMIGYLHEVTLSGETFSKVLHVTLCPNRLEFPWQFRSSVEWDDWPYGYPGRNYTVHTEKICIYVGKQEILNFLRRGILHSGNDSWPYDALFPGLADQVKDDWEVKKETQPDQEGSAHAPLFATFAAHFAEASERFNPYNCEREPWSVRQEYKLLIPITDGSDAWFGIRGKIYP